MQAQQLHTTVWIIQTQQWAWECDGWIQTEDIKCIIFYVQTQPKLEAVEFV